MDVNSGWSDIEKLILDNPTNIGETLIHTRFVRKKRKIAKLPYFN
jgi:hypothetical protein